MSLLWSREIGIGARDVTELDNPCDVTLLCVSSVAAGLVRPAARSCVADERLRRGRSSPSRVAGAICTPGVTDNGVSVGRHN